MLIILHFLEGQKIVSLDGGEHFGDTSPPNQKVLECHCKKVQKQTKLDCF